MSERGLRVESSCLGFADLADTGDVEGKDPTATDLAAEPLDWAVFLGRFLTPVMLLRFPWHRYEPTIQLVQRHQCKDEKSP